MLSIGTLSRRTGVKVTTIRYYESRGMIADPGRSSGGQRRYGQAELDRLTFIAHARALGLPLDQIATLLDLEQGEHDKAHDIAATHLAQVRARIAQLQRLETELQRIASSCTGDSPDCRISQAFGDHTGCGEDHR